MLTKAQRGQVFRDPQWTGYFSGADFLNAQPPSIVPDDWHRDGRWLLERTRRDLFDLHVDFLESLFDKDGFVTLYRAMDKHPKVSPGDVVDLGEFWTYSGDADLSHAQVASSARYKTGFAARVHESQIDWPQTISDHTGRWDNEKQFYVRGPVEILDVFPVSEWKSRTKKRSFERWAKSKLS